MIALPYVLHNPVRVAQWDSGWESLGLVDMGGGSRPYSLVFSPPVRETPRGIAVIDWTATQEGRQPA